MRRTQPITKYQRPTFLHVQLLKWLHGKQQQQQYGQIFVPVKGRGGGGVDRPGEGQSDCVGGGAVLCITQTTLNVPTLIPGLYSIPLYIKKVFYIVNNTESL